MGSCESKHTELANRIVNQNSPAKSRQKQSQLLANEKPLEQEPSTSNTIAEVEADKENKIDQ